MWFNPLVKFLVQSRFHKLVSQYILVIGYRGRISGKWYETPVNYFQKGEMLLITSRRERKWWRNLRDGAPVTIWLRGKMIQAKAEALTSHTDVASNLQAYLQIVPKQAKYFQVALTEQGQPEPTSLWRAAQELVMIRVLLPVAENQDIGRA